MQNLNENLSVICEENKSVIESVSSKVMATIEELEEIVKASNSGKLIASVKALRENIESGLLVSHKQTIELYETNGNEAGNLMKGLN